MTSDEYESPSDTPGELEEAYEQATLGEQEEDDENEEESERSEDQKSLFDFESP